MNVKDLDSFCQAGQISALPPFDNTLTTTDERGEHIRFLLNPDDDRYIYRPQGEIPPGMLPPEDFEVRANFLRVSITHKIVSIMPWEIVFMRPMHFVRRLKDAHFARQAMRECLAKSPLHLKAFQRIVKGLPQDVAQHTVRAFLGTKREMS